MKTIPIRTRSTGVIALAAAVILGCGPMRDSGPSVSRSTPDTGAVKHDSAGGAVAGLTDSSAKKTPHDTAKKTVTDTTVRRGKPARLPDVAVDLLKGRTTHDSSSFVTAIRSGQNAVGGWPTHPVPPGAILPGRRIIAFYGNPLVKKMGVLGEYPVNQMLAKFDSVIAEWNAADPSTPVQPALHLIAVVASGDPGRGGKYRHRMADTLIERVYGWAQQRHAILFLDVQVGGSTLQEELPRLIPFLSRPDVHLGIDPEFSMHYGLEGHVPSSRIGIMDAEDVNFAVTTLSNLVAEKHLPPKILIVHRFTGPMVRNASNIRVDPNVQIVMNMDGFGPPWLKFDSYDAYIVRQPVQFTGFKIFFHNDKRLGDPILTPAEVLRLLPRPLYIQYQ